MPAVARQCVTWVAACAVEAAIAGGLPSTLDTNAQLKLIFRYYCRFGRTTGDNDMLRTSQGVAHPGPGGGAQLLTPPRRSACVPQTTRTGPSFAASVPSCLTAGTWVLGVDTTPGGPAMAGIGMRCAVTQAHHGCLGFPLPLASGQSQTRRLTSHSQRVRARKSAACRTAVSWMHCRRWRARNSRTPTPQRASRCCSHATCSGAQLR